MNKLVKRRKNREEDTVVIKQGGWNLNYIWKQWNAIGWLLQTHRLAADIISVDQETQYCEDVNSSPNTWGQQAFKIIGTPGPSSWDPQTTGQAGPTPCVQWVKGAGPRCSWKLWVPFPARGSGDQALFSRLSKGHLSLPIASQQWWKSTG